MPTSCSSSNTAHANDGTASSSCSAEVSSGITNCRQCVLDSGEDESGLTPSPNSSSNHETIALALEALAPGGGSAATSAVPRAGVHERSGGAPRLQPHRRMGREHHCGGSGRKSMLVRRGASAPRPRARPPMRSSRSAALAVVRGATARAACSERARGITWPTSGSR
eukprot:5482163-Prymnesium_polylepis.2